MSIGIYKITNPIGEVYIGLSENIERRIEDYKQYKNIKNNTLLINSFKKYHYNKHHFEIIEECGIRELRKKEKYWIKYFNSFKNGLNQNKGGSGCYKHSEETKKKIGLSNSKPKPQIFIEKISKPRKNFPKGKNHGHFGKSNSRKGIKLSNEVIQKMKKSKIGNTYRRKKVLQFDLEDNFIKKWESVTQIQNELGYKTSQISLCCNNKNKTAYKFKWKYE